MEFSISSGVLMLVSDKKTITLDSDSVLCVDGMSVELPGEYEKSGFLIQSRFLRTPFDPIAVAHKDLQKQMKQKQAEEIGSDEIEDEDVELPQSEDAPLSVEASDESASNLEINTSTQAMIHSLNIEGYNVLLLTSDMPLKILKDEYFANFIKKIDLIATSGGEGSVDLIRLVEPRITLVYGDRSEGLLMKLGKTSEPVSKWKSRESDFQSDEGVVVSLTEEK